MTTTDLVKALRICSRRTGYKGCGPCPLFDDKDCMGDVTGWAADLIEWLIGANANLHEEIDRKNEVQALYHKKLVTLDAERDALREKVPQWINVKDRLPNVWKNEDAGVLVNYMIYGPYFGVNIGNYHKEAEEWFCAGLPVTVTHWMPLPEAPEEGEKA